LNALGEVGLGLDPIVDRAACDLEASRKIVIGGAEHAELAGKLGILGLVGAGTASFAHVTLLLCLVWSPSLVFRAPPPTTDFLGTGAGGLTFARGLDSSLVAPSLQNGRARSRRSGLKRRERQRLVMPLFGAVRTNESQC